jgi:N utilization substance protein B
VSPESSRADERHRAREAALQMLYQWEVGGASIDEVIETFWTSHANETVAPGREMAARLARGTAEALASVDPLIGAAAENWRLSRMAIVDRLILRLAVYEFLRMPDTPRTVVINEALELAKTFSADESVGFINGVLDGVRKQLEEEAHAPERPQ